MKRLVVHAGDTAQWHELVHEAEAAAGCALPEETESYLVFMLMRFALRPKIARHCLAISYLHALLQRGTPRHHGLRDVGDQCLLYTGLFPDYLRRRTVPVGYYVRLGRSAYAALSGERNGDIFEKLSHAFIEMMDVLLNMRALDEGRPCLDPLQAHELWLETGSRHALKVAKQATGTVPINTARRSLH